MTGFLFDNDGVLLDTTELHWRSWQLLMQEEAHFAMTRAQFTQGFGKTNKLILDETLPSAPAEQKRRWSERKEQLFRELVRAEGVQLIEGMDPFLQQVKEVGIPRIIASSTPAANLELF